MSECVPQPSETRPHEHTTSSTLTAVLQQVSESCGFDEPWRGWERSYLFEMPCVDSVLLRCQQFSFSARSWMIEHKHRTDSLQTEELCETPRELTWAAHGSRPLD